MKERPILFNGEMVRAVLDGRKTQTRRVITTNKKWADEIHLVEQRDSSLWPYNGWHDSIQGPDGCEHLIPCPYGVPGDRLWVRETWRLSTSDDCACYDPCRCKSGVPIYKAHNDCGEETWKPSIYMPRWASRILLEVVQVRVQRVQEITPADAIAEGIPPVRLGEQFSEDAFDFASIEVWKFRKLWDSINAKRGFGWDVNPWVWAITFKVIEAAK